MAYIAPKYIKELGRVGEDILGKMGSWKGTDWLKIKCL